MNELLQAMRAASEARAELRAAADAGDETRIAEARAAVDTAETALNTAIDAEIESREEDLPTELRERISLGHYLVARANDRPLAGAEREANTELGLSDEQVPLECLEMRADAISPQGADGNALASGATQTTRAPIVARVFTQTDAAYLGVDMPMVPPGQRAYPVMTDGTSASMAARGGGPDAGAAKFAIVNATPKRLTGRYIFDLEGVAELGAELETMLRADLRAEMGFQLDSQILLGSGVAPNVTGILKALDILNPPGAAAAKDSPQLTWANFRQVFTDGLDGKLSRTEADLRSLIGGDTYTTARQLYRNANAGDAQDAIAAAAALGAAVRRSFQIPAAGPITVKGQSAASKKHQRMVVSAEPMAAIAPVWQGITLIRDPYSNAKDAQVVLTAHMLFDFIIRRKDGWRQYAINVKNEAV
ncbi:MAG: phage major capsid protein [Chloroflexi bacterium]|nr:phage major capsid protein [Chloroflexota bacterium]